MVVFLGHLIEKHLGVNAKVVLRIGATHVFARCALSIVGGIGRTEKIRLQLWRLHIAEWSILLQAFCTEILLHGSLIVTPVSATTAKQWTWIGNGCRVVMVLLVCMLIHGPDRYREHDHGHDSITIPKMIFFILPDILPYIYDVDNLKACGDGNMILPDLLLHVY